MFRVLSDGAKDLVIIFISNNLVCEDETLPLSVNMPGTQSEPIETAPVQTVPAANEGDADVPDFEKLGSELNYRSNKLNDDDSVTYFFHDYNLSESKADEYINKFIQLLTGNNFVQCSYEKKKFDHKRVEAIDKARSGHSVIQVPKVFGP